MPPKANTDEDRLNSVLGNIGIKYTHVNDDLLKPSAIEEERANQAIEVRLTL